MGWFQKLMTGRYGIDHLNIALFSLYILLYLIAWPLNSFPLKVVDTICLLWALFRMFSRRADRRQAENAKFLDMLRPMVRWYNVRKCRRNDKDHCYFKCPNCGQQLRVPKGKGKVSITCRSCGATFEENT